MDTITSNGGENDFLSRLDLDSEAWLENEKDRIMNVGPFARFSMGV